MLGAGLVLCDQLLIYIQSRSCSTAESILVMPQNKHIYRNNSI
uniref:Uncharacterized protein n=1 Tax=Nelumbo nucifera TaxID=4432 RepID=A0A822ZI56_NELNU|nr:TPA_asm: hypothetical protein HUJ06_002450 [Nelumbo nucifera]